MFILNILGHYPGAVKSPPEGRDGRQTRSSPDSTRSLYNDRRCVKDRCTASSPLYRRHGLPPGLFRPAGDRARSAGGSEGPGRRTGSTARAGLFDAIRLLEATIVGLPAYLERHGSGPTAVAMVLAYHDGHGFPYLLPGDASIQTDLVNLAIASEEHYNDYALPLDAPPDLLPDKSELPAEEQHADNCLADYCLTSRSLYGNYYGWTRDADLGPGIEAFVQAGERYAVVTEALPASTITLTTVRNEIASGRPPVFAVDTDGDGTEDRFVAVFGINSEAGVDYYGCYTGWDTELHWYEFRPAAAGVPWGVATVHTIALSYGVFPPANVRLERLVNDLIFFKEYINRLSWEPNPDNLVRILRYKIYRKETFDPDVDVRPPGRSRRLLDRLRRPGAEEGHRRTPTASRRSTNPAGKAARPPSAARNKGHRLCPARLDFSAPSV